MLKSLVIGLATAAALSVASLAGTTAAQADGFSFTITTGGHGGFHNVHHRHRKWHRRHYERRYYDDRRGRHHRRHWKRVRDGHGHRHGRGGWRGDREVCHVHKRVVTFYDRYGTPHRKVKRHRSCEWR